MPKLYDIILRRSALKDMRRFPQTIVQNIEEHIATLATNPVPSDAQLIKGYTNYYRIRVGNYRIIYEVATAIRIVTIMKIGHRKDVYKNI